MSRFSPQKAYAHSVQFIMADTYRLSWTIDKYPSGSRLRTQSRQERITDEAGAKRFCEKHGLEFEKVTP